MTHPQVLSDEQIEKVTADNSLDTIHAVARAIESATLEAVRGRAVALYVEPHALEVMTQAAARDCTSNAYLSGSIKPTPTKTQALYLHPSTTQPPAQAEREALLQAARVQALEDAANRCRAVAEGFGGLAAGPFCTDFGKHTHQSMAAGALNCAADIDNMKGQQ